MASANGFVVVPAAAFSPSPAVAGAPSTAEIDLLAPVEEVVPSWNASAEGGALKVEIQALYPDRASAAFDMGTWSLDARFRTSTNGQDGPDGKVLTDTLRLKTPAQRLRIIVTPIADESGRAPTLSQVFLSLSPPDWKAADQPLSRAASAAWGMELPVPEKAQHNYPNGNVLCSPTSISMIMNWLGKRLNRPELEMDVPDVVARIHDPGWGGTGNWPFNTALPGSFGGVRSFVTRLNGLRDAESFIAAGLPLAISLNYKHLLQKEWDGDGGHLVVLIGFTESGDPIVNDPAKKSQVRQIYPRKRFAEAWASSKFTVYVVHGVGDKLPSGEGPWPSEHS